MSSPGSLLIGAVAARFRNTPCPTQWATRGALQAAAWGLFFGLLSACGTAVATPEPIELWLSASSSAQPFFQTLAVAYQQAHPEVTIRLVPAANSQAAGHQLAVGNVDAALLTDPAIQSNRVTLQVDQIGWDSLVVVAHPDNRLQTLTWEEVQAIFRGQTREWPSRARIDGIIQVLSREEGSGLRLAFEDQVMGGRPVTRTGLIMPDNADMRDAVAETPQAIGYLPASWLNGSVKALAVDGTQSLLTSHDPLRMPIYLLTHEQPSSDAGKLRDFLLTAAGQAALGENALSWRKE